MARKQNNKVVAIESVESRVMMSASVVVHATAAKPVPHAAKVVKLVNPALTNKSISYKSFANNPLFSPAGPSINDVSQGELGDCYLLSTLSSVAKTDASLIEHDVVANGNGTFNVTFGHSAPITVNADLPVLRDGQLAYAQLGADDSIWVAVVEKAYAEFHNPKANSYATINGGWMGDVFNALGLANQSYTATNAKSLMTTLAADLKAKDFTTFATANKLARSGPLIADHAYEVDSINDDSNGNAVSVTLRNPWGNDVANGGYVTITAAQAFTAFAGGVIAEA
jgi:hypothetical protein